MERRRIDTYRFREITVYSMIIGAFAWAPLLFIIAGFQNMLTYCGVSCEGAWTLLWNIATVLCLLIPFTVPSYIKQHYLNIDKVHNRLKLFNLIEYTLLFSATSRFMITADFLCNDTDGQTAMVFGLTGWLSLPVLYILNRIFERILKHKLQARRKH